MLQQQSFANTHNNQAGQKMSISSLTVRTKPKYKLILLGDQAVGKTCLIEQFVNNRFEDSQAPTVGIDFVVTNIVHKGKQYRLQLWDTAGQQRFKSLIPSYLKDSQCALVLYDVNNKQSCANVDKWLALYRENVDESAFCVVVGNKIDTKGRFAGQEAVKDKWRQRNVEYLEVSAKTGKNVQQLFHRIIELIQEKNNRPILDGQILQTVQQNQAKSQQRSGSIKLKVSSQRSNQNSPHTNKQKCC